MSGMIGPYLAFHCHHSCNHPIINGRLCPMGPTAELAALSGHRVILFPPPPAFVHRETNLKFRQALLVTHQELVSEESMATFDGESPRQARMQPSHCDRIGSALGSLCPLRHQVPSA